MRSSGSSLRSLSLWLIVWIWLVCVGAHAAYYVSVMSAHTEDITNLYGRTGASQLLNFAFFRFPIWVGVLFALLLLRGSSQKDT
jgi:hypothetical protein